MLNVDALSLTGRSGITAPPTSRFMPSSQPQTTTDAPLLSFQTKSGRLFKRSRKGLFWNSRWVLVGNRQMQIRNSESDISAKQVISLEYGKIQILPRKGNKFPFELTTALGIKFEFAAESEHSRGVWMDFIGKQIHTMAESWANSGMAIPSSLHTNTPQMKSNSAVDEPGSVRISTQDQQFNDPISERATIYKPNDFIGDQDYEDSEDESLSEVAEETMVQKVPAPWSHRSVQSDGKSRITAGTLVPIETEDEEDGADWNERYQRVLELKENSFDDSVIKALKLNRITSKFVERASHIGRTIIAEYCLPFELKTVKPIMPESVSDNFDGFNHVDAEKCTFVEDSIVFQFIHDYSDVLESMEEDGLEISLEDTFLNELEEGKMKTATNDIHGITAYLNTSDSLHPPLCCIIDYMGFRLFAIALMPLVDAYSLAYGRIAIPSNDEETQITWHHDPVVEEELSRCGVVIGLKEHSIEEENGELCRSVASLDLKVYRGEDGRYYLSNLSRVFPVDWFEVAKSQKNGKLSEEPYWFTKQLREEYLISYENSLSSDAFTEYSSEEDDLTVAEASKQLVEVVIPKFVYKLDMLEFMPMSGYELCDKMHYYGINLRYLGRVATLSRLDYIKRLAVSEMVGRACKKLLQSRLRNMIREQFEITQHDAVFNIEKEENELQHAVLNSVDGLADILKSEIVTFFNLIVVDGEKSRSFWRNEIYPKLRSKFEGFDNLGISKDELKASIFPSLLLQSVAINCGLQFKDNLDITETQMTGLRTVDLKDIFVQTKFPEKRNLKCFELPNKAEKLMKDGSWNFAIQALKMKNEIVLGQKVGLHFLRKKEYLFIENLNQLCEAYIQKENTSAAKEQARQALEVAGDDFSSAHVCQTYFHLVNLYFLEDDLELSMESFDQATAILALMFGEDHRHPFGYLINDLVACNWLQKRDFTMAEKYFKEALHFALISLGRKHPLTGKAYSRLANCLHFSGIYQNAKVLYMDALDIYEKVYGKVSLGVAQVCYYISDVYSNTGDYDSALRFAEKSLSIRREMVGQNDLLTVDSIHQIAWLSYRFKRVENALSFFKVLIDNLKQSDDSSSMSELKNIVTAMMKIEIERLPHEEAELVAKIKNQHAEYVFDNPNLREIVVEKLFTMDPSSYLRELLSSIIVRKYGYESSIDELAVVCKLIEAVDIQEMDDVADQSSILNHA